jgi:hypothetical protein
VCRWLLLRFALEDIEIIRRISSRAGLTSLVEVVVVEVPPLVALLVLVLVLLFLLEQAFYFSVGFLNGMNMFAYWLCE